MPLVLVPVTEDDLIEDSLVCTKSRIIEADAWRGRLSLFRTVTTKAKTSTLTMVYNLQSTSQLYAE
jgi:hypothetical protein